MQIQVCYLISKKRNWGKSSKIELGCKGLRWNQHAQIKKESE
jgi:hypothetical protein